MAVKRRGQSLFWKATKNENDSYWLVIVQKWLYPKELSNTTSTYQLQNKKHECPKVVLYLGFYSILAFFFYQNSVKTGFKSWCQPQVCSKAAFKADPDTWPLSVNVSPARGLKAWLGTPGKNTLLGVPPWFSHQNNHVSGWLVDKCEREHRKSFPPKENERPISSVSWQPWATVGSYWILSELYQGRQEERVMIKSSLEEGWNRLSPLVFTLVQCYFPWDGLGPNRTVLCFAQISICSQV